MNQRVRRELVLAQNIQRNLLPEKRKSFPGIDHRHGVHPLRGAGRGHHGRVPDRRDRLGVYGGDVCGHGIYAAMVMSYVKKLIETSVKRILLNRQYVVKPPGAVLTTINQSFITEISQGDPEIYLTLFLGVLDMETLTFEYSSAGTHVPPLVSVQRDRPRCCSSSPIFPSATCRNHEYTTDRHAVRSRGDTLPLRERRGDRGAGKGDVMYGMERLRQEAARMRAENGGVDADAVMPTCARSWAASRPRTTCACCRCRSCKRTTREQRSAVRLEVPPGTGSPTAGHCGCFPPFTGHPAIRDVRIVDVYIVQRAGPPVDARRGLGRHCPEVREAEPRDAQTRTDALGAQTRTRRGGSRRTTDWDSCGGHVRPGVTDPVALTAREALRACLPGLVPPEPSSRPPSSPCLGGALGGAGGTPAFTLLPQSADPVRVCISAAGGRKAGARRPRIPTTEAARPRCASSTSPGFPMQSWRSSRGAGSSPSPSRR